MFGGDVKLRKIFYRVCQWKKVFFKHWWIFDKVTSKNVPSVLWCCWLGGRKGIRPVKTEWRGAGLVICLERDADLHTAQLMPLPLTVSCFSKIQIRFAFLVPAHPGSPGKWAVKRVCVCYKQECSCLMHFLRLLAVCWLGAQSAWDNHVLACNIFPDFKHFFTDRLGKKSFLIWHPHQTLCK